MPFKKSGLGLLLLTFALAGCKSEVLDPAGPVATQQRDLLISATLLMLLIIIPVMALTLWFGWQYRAGNPKADYRPNWDHSTKLELVIWAAPLLIIISLGAMTWVGTHLTDPFRPLAQDGKGRSLEGVAPLRVDVVALDWKWLFILPDEGVAAVNDLALPVGRPVEFHLTAQTAMNAFYVPAMAGMVYAMPGMETRLNGLFDREGTFQGIASHYSGAGFSGMKFKVNAVDDKGFSDWVAQAKSGATLDRPAYLKLAEKSENNPPAYFGAVEDGLFERAVNRCVPEGKMCQSEMMALDMKAGTGAAAPLALALPRPGGLVTGGLVTGGLVTGGCSIAEPKAACTALARQAAALPATGPLLGRGLPSPGELAPNPFVSLPATPSDL